MSHPDLRLYAANARAAGVINLRGLLHYLWQWRIVDVHVVQRLLGLSRNRAYVLLRRAREAGYIAEVMGAITSGGAYRLTEQGRDAILVEIPPDWRQVRPAAKRGNVQVTRVPHDLLVQHAVMDLMSSPMDYLRSVYDQVVGRGRDSDSEAVRNLFVWAEEFDVVVEARNMQRYPASYLWEHNIRPDRKVPDAMVRCDEEGLDLRIAVEVQQSDESPETIKSILSRYAESLKIERARITPRSTPEEIYRQRRRIDAVVYYSSCKPILDMYQEIWGPDLPVYQLKGQGENRRWKRVDDSLGMQSPWREWMGLRLHVIHDTRWETVYYPGRRRR